MNIKYMWTDEEIAKYYDKTPNLSLENLSMITGRTIAELKEILMGGKH